MARQMVFTSTPQGLEPGRTGFCTVARHRSLRSRLVRELERTSVYEFNLAQGATKAKINSFRHFELGTEEFYVLTRIRDAGLDYTNRTNYIAHHLIFDGLEIAVNPSPAEIFLQWTDWLDVWEGSPRWFEDDEITDVSSCKMTGLSPAQSWQSATGDGGNAAYLIAEKAKRPVLLEVLPGEEDKLLHLFAESCALVPLPMEAWQFPFTTFLQETDDAKDFAWIGGCGQTAVERLKLNGVPNHLNFTAFDQRSVKDPMDEKLVFIARNGRKAVIEKKTPPPPPVAEPAGVGGTVVAGPGSPSTTISAGRSGDAFSRTEKEQFRQAAASHAAAQATATTAGGDGSKKRRKRPKWPWITAIAAVMLLAVFVAYQAGLFEAMMKPSGDGEPLSQGGGSSSNGDGGKKPDVPPDETDPKLKPPDSPSGIAVGVPTLAKVTAKDDPSRNRWIEFQIGSAEPTKIDLTAMTDADHERFGEKLRNLDVGSSMTMTFREGSEPGRFAIANLEPPSSPLNPVQANPVPTPPLPIPGAPAAIETEISGSEVGLDESDLSVTLPPSGGVELPAYQFLPSQKARFIELQKYVKAGDKVRYSYRIVGGRIADFDFSVVARVDPLSGSPSVHSLSAPPPFPVTESFVLWLTKAEVEDPDLASTSIHGDAAFVQTLKTKLHRIASTKGRAFVWGTDYVGPQAFVEVSPMDGSRPYTVVHKPVDLGFVIDQYTLETPQDEGSTLFLRFLFKSASEVDVLFETQGARNAAKRGVLLRLPDLETNRALDLYLLSPRVVGAKPNELPKEHLSMDRNRVTMAKNGAFGHGLQAIGSAGPLTLKLSVNPSENVFFGSNLRPSDFTTHRLKSFPPLLVKSVPEDPMICELALFIDYMLDLRKEFQREIDKLNAGNNDEFGVKMPKPKIFDALKLFGKRAGYSHDYAPGAGRGTYGPFMIDVTMNFFKQVHGYSDEASDLLEKDLVLDPKGFMLVDFQHREFWKKVCARAKQEASAPFGLGYDPKNLARDVDRVFGTLRFLRESERAFGIKDQGIDLMILGTVKEIMDRDNGAIGELYDQLVNYKDTPEGKAAAPKYSVAQNKYLADFVKVGAPVELTTAEFRKAINCIEDPVLAKKYHDLYHGFKAKIAQKELRLLKHWLAELGKEIAKKDTRVAPEEYESSVKLRRMKYYFHAEEWSLSLFRDGQDEPEAELVRFINRN